MTDIRVEKQVGEDRLQSLGVRQWPIWSKEPSEFPWTYDATETCYLLEGRVIVTPEGGDPVEFGKGDLVTFRSGLKCTWKVLETVRKHYTFHETSSGTDPVRKGLNGESVSRQNS